MGYVVVTLALLAVVVYVVRFGSPRSEPIDVSALRATRGTATPMASIPRKIWTYWEGPENKLIQKCMARCRRLNPGYTLTVLNPQNVRELIPELPAELLNHAAFNDSLARKADLIRCFAIAYHGGIWMDASIICLKPFDAWLDLTAEFAGFYLQGFTTLPEHPVVENWFFASRPGCRFMEEWCWEFARLAEFGSVDEYIQHLVDTGVSLQAIGAKTYLAMHCAAQRVMQQVVPGVGSNGLILHRAEDGPYRFLVAPEVEWDSKRGLLYVIDSWEQLVQQVPFHKLRSTERTAVKKLSPDKRQRFLERIDE